MTFATESAVLASGYSFSAKTQEVTISSMAPKKQLAAIFSLSSGAEVAGSLTIANGGADDLKVFDHVLVRKGREKASALAKLHLKDDSEITIGAEGLKVQDRRGGVAFRQASVWWPIRRAHD